MLKTPPRPSNMFNLEGTLIGFLGGNAHKPAALALEVDDEPLAVQLPRALRARAQTYLRAGDRVRCIGWAHVDLKAGMIRLKADQVFQESNRP